jgi:hypothetical protein
MMVIIVMVMVLMSAAGICARFRIEGRLDRIDVPAETRDHVCDHMIGADTNTIAEQLHRQMSVAKMPGDADQFACTVRMDLQQWLGFRADPHHATVIDPQPVVVAQPHRLREIEQHLTAGFGWQQNAPTMPPIKVDHHTINFLGRIPGPGRQHAVGAHQNKK